MVSTPAAGRRPPPRANRPAARPARRPPARPTPRRPARRTSRGRALRPFVPLAVLLAPVAPLWREEEVPPSVAR
ncbi:hypothetical protein, partial [Modestobacter marinus]|uniref:hypothetical protein n=1 Tax=Modestobacter marinus TaxID=477641 RepID=UPI00201A255E